MASQVSSSLICNISVLLSATSFYRARLHREKKGMAYAAGQWNRRVMSAGEGVEQ